MHIRLPKLVPVWLALFASMAQHCLLAQNQHLIDSLEARLKALDVGARESGQTQWRIRDSSAANVLNRLGKAWMDSDTARAMNCLRRELALSERIGYQLGVCRSLNNMAFIYEGGRNLEAAVEHAERSLTVARAIGDRRIIKFDLVLLGQIRYQQGQYPEALESYLASLEFFDDGSDRKELAQVYNNMANVYQKVGNDREALNMLNASLRVREELGDTLAMAQSRFNIGKMHYILLNELDAKENYELALLFYQRKSNKRGIASCLREMSQLSLSKSDLNEALDLAHRALAIDKEIGNEQGITGDLNSIALVHDRQGKHDQAITTFKQVLSLAEDAGDSAMVASACKGLATSYEALGRTSEALWAYKRYTSIKESLSSREVSRRIAELYMQHDFDDQAAKARSAQDRKDLIAQAALDQHKFERNAFIGGFGLMLLFAGVFLVQRNRIAKEKRASETEKQRSNELLLNILPTEVANELRRTGQCQPKTYSMVTVLFADFKDFTTVSEEVSAELLVSEIDACFKSFDAIMEKHRIEKIKTVGDAYMCASGLPSLSYTHAEDMVDAALEMNAFMAARKAERAARGEFAFEQRIGIHTGPVVAGIVGNKKFSYDLWGDTVNLAARMEQNGEVGKVNISGATYKLVKDRFACTYRGKIQAKNKGAVDMYFVESK